MVSIVVIMERRVIVVRRNSSIWRRRRKRKERFRNSLWKMWGSQLWKERRKKKLLSDSLSLVMLKRIAHRRRRSQHPKKTLLCQAKNIDHIVITPRRKKREKVNESIVIIIIELFVVSRDCWRIISFGYSILLPVVSILLYTVCNKYQLQKWNILEDVNDTATRCMKNRKYWWKMGTRIVWNQRNENLEMLMLVPSLPFELTGQVIYRSPHELVYLRGFSLKGLRFGLLFLTEIVSLGMSI